MPEGHTIHRLANDLRRDLRGRAVLAESPQGRFATSAARLNGNVVRATAAFGKQLFVDFDHGDVLSVHLGLIGKFRRVGADRAPSEQTRLRLRAPDADFAWDLTGPMACEIIDRAKRRTIASAIGPDPLRRDADVDEFIRRARAKRAPIGAVLLDQSVIAGIGNVYRAELCFLCGIDPRRSAESLRDDELRALWDGAVRQLTDGVRRNRIVTRPADERGRTKLADLTLDQRLYVYKRGGAPCHRCGDPITLVELGARSCWYCGRCQA